MKKQLFFILLISSLTCFAESDSFNSPFDGYIEAQKTNNESSVLAAVGSGFNYQGVLMDSGSVANNNFDFSFQLYDALTGGSQIGSTVIKGNRQVDGGLFSIENVDFGDAVYTGDELWLSVTVRETGNTGSETTLSPRQQIDAVPYAVQADYLGPIGASEGNILQFTGGKWEPTFQAGDPWSFVGVGGGINYIRYLGGDIHVVNGGASLGASGGEAPPVNGLLVKGSTVLAAEGGASVSNSNGILSVGSTSDDHITFDKDDIQARNGSINDTATLYLNFFGGDVSLAKDGDNTDVRGSLSVKEDIVANAKITAADSGAADMKAYVYGRANSTGVKITSQSSDGFVVSRASTGLYRINFNDTSINSDYIVVANTNASSPKFASVVVGIDGFDLHVWDTDGNHSDHSFQFVVYRK